MRNIQFVFLITVVLSSSLFAQSGLKVLPDTLRYTDKFERLQHLYIYNESENPISIDSIYIDESIYYPRFDREAAFPITLQPSDSLVMDCVFWNYWAYSYGTYDSAIVVYSNSWDDVFPISSRINIDNINPGYGKITGTVNSGGSPVANAKVLFYRNGINLSDSSKTDDNGKYNVTLLAGNYFISVEKEGYILSYFSRGNSPLNAEFIELESNDELFADINIDLASQTGFTVRGNIFDRQVNSLAKKRRSGVVVARKGDHNPSKVSGTSNHKEKIYTGIIYSDGSYSINNIEESGYYYIQAFAEFYVPGYYSKVQNSTMFWQDADSVYIDAGAADNFDIYLERDSSYGAGVISGRINSNLDSNFVNTIVYAQSDNDLIYTHNFVGTDGKYSIGGLPYGRYKIVAQLIGFKDAVSEFVEIDPVSYVKENVDIDFSTTVVETPEILPDDFKLYQNYPNPFNPETVISFTLNRNSFVRLKVFDVLGKEIALVAAGQKNAGNYSINFNATGLSSGVYYYQLTAGRIVQTRKMMLIK